MAFYVKKSLSVGPLRFNLSKSGIGVSAGIPGFRVGTGPRGNYVHMGRHGLYYRASLPSAKQRGRSAPRQVTPSPREETPHPVGAVPDQPLEAIESAEVSGMRDSSSADLLQEFDRKRKLVRLAPLVGGLSLIAVVLSAAGGQPNALSLALLALGAAATAGAHVYDQMRKTVVLFYDLDEHAERDYKALHAAHRRLQGSSKTWNIEGAGSVGDQKRNAGATGVVERKDVSPRMASPPFVKTNVEVPSLPAGKQTLYFFPDRLLVFEGSSVGAVSYSDLKVERAGQKFIEDGSVPRDATQVDQTWQYVNKKGGPDKRFKDNRELPVLMYEQLHLSSESGLNERFQFSKADVADKLEWALETAARSVPRAGS